MFTSNQMLNKDMNRNMGFSILVNYYAITEKRYVNTHMGFGIHGD